MAAARRSPCVCRPIHPERRNADLAEPERGCDDCPPVSNAPAPTAAPANPTQPGTILAGKYRVERILGQGGMGVVVEARHIALDERVALKFLLPEYANHPEASARFLREARNAVKIKSEHVARVSDVGTLESGAPYMVMEFLEGRDLAGTLEKTGVLTIPDAVDYVIQGCEAIAEAHSYGIVHRDLKPANLFLSKRPDGSPIVKVLDFGISKSGGGNAVDNLTKTTAAMGSALYMSPEQMQQTRSVDHRTDVYALGISLYELLAGKQPFYADTLPQLCAAILTGTPQPIRELRPDVSDTFAAVIERAYARDRAQRYQSVAEFVIALAPWAPPRSATTIERVARMAGLPVPEPQPQQQAAPAPPPMSPPVQGGTQLMTEPMPIPAPAPPQPPSQPPPSANPNQIVPGPYSAPMSVRAAATFKQGALRGPTITGQPRSMGAVFALVALGMLAIGGIIGAVVLRGIKAGGGAPTASVSVAPTPPPPAETASTQPASSQAPPEPKPTDAAEPPATASAKPDGPAPTHRPGAPLPKSTPSAKPTSAPSAPPPSKPAVDPLAPPKTLFDK
jgi:serine/threonine-protein kinase